MEPWLKITLILCVYGVLKEIRPSESYVTNYLNTQMNFTFEVINEELYPVSIYSTFCTLIVIFLVTDLLRYKPIIVINSIAGVVIYVMLITCRSLFLIQIVEVFYGVFVASEVAYYTYIYAKVDKEHYQDVTGHTRAAILTGRSLSGLTAQLFITFGFSYYSLNFLTLGGQILGLIWALSLPPVASSIYFNRNDDSRESNPLQAKNGEPFQTKLKIGFKHLWQDFVAAFTNTYVIKWSIWSAVATCGYLQMIQFIQILWEAIIGSIEEQSRWNGAVDFIFTLLSALTAYGFGQLKLNWAKYGDALLFSSSFIIGVVIYIISQTQYILVAYIGYIFQAIVYNAAITIANSEVAKKINPDSCSLIFGFINFVALSFQSLLTLTVVNALKLDAISQFVVYGVFYMVLGSLYGVIMIVRWIRECSGERQTRGEFEETT